MYQQNIYIGNLGNDPEMKYTPSGQAVTKFSLAVNREYNTADGQHVKEVMWLRISAWGKLAEVCQQYLAKGSRVLVEGRFSPDKETGGPRIWTDKSGKAHADYELTASVVRFLSESKKQAEDPGVPDF